MMVEWLWRAMSADEEQNIAAYMSRLATAGSRYAPRLPTAEVLWVKAQMLERWEAERRVQKEGLTIGHWPQSVELSTVGGWVATRAAGQFSTAYGSIEDLVLAVSEPYRR